MSSNIELAMYLIGTVGGVVFIIYLIYLDVEKSTRRGDAMYIGLFIVCLVLMMYIW